MKYLIIISLLLMGPFTQGQNWSHIYGQLKVLDVAEHQNNLWVATDQGLIKVDQLTMQTTHYTTDNSALPDNHIQTISIDLLGNIWIGTYDFSLVQIDPINNTWNVYNYPTSVQGNSTSGIRIYCSDIAPNGDIWLGTSKGLLSFDGTTWGWTAYTGQVPIWDMSINNTGQIDIASFNLLTYDINLDTWAEHYHPSLSNNNIAYNEARIVRQNDSTVFLFANHFLAGAVHRIQNGVWTSWNNALGAGSGSSNVPISPRHNGSRPTIAPNGYIYYNLHTEHLVYFDGTQWLVDSSLTTQNTGLQSIDYCFFSTNGDTWAFRDNISVKHNTTTTTNDILLPLVTFNHISKSTIDINQDFYLTSAHVGIQKHDNGNWLPIAGSANYDNHRITKFDANNNAWFVSKNTGTNEPTIMQQTGSTWYTHDHTSSGGILPSVGSFYNIEISSTGFILARDDQDYIYKFVNNTWSQISSVPDPSDVFASEMSADVFGNIWWMERHAINLTTYNYFLKKYDGNTIQSTLNNQLTFVKPYLDESGHLWTSFGKGQLNKYDGTTWSTYTFVSNALVAHITGRNGTIFLGTTNEGVYQFDGQNWSNFNESNSPLTYNDCRGIQLDRMGQLWIQNALGGVIDIYDTGLLVLSSTQSIDNEEILALEIAPNPSSDQIHVNCPLNEVQSIAIVNAMGQKVLDLKNTTTQTVRISELPNGIYWLVANNAKTQIRTAFVKQ